MSGGSPALRTFLTWLAVVATFLTGCSAPSGVQSSTSLPSNPETTPAATPAAGVSPSPAASASPSPSPSPTPVDVLPAGVVNVLFFGTDSREPTSLQGNADAIVVAQLSADRRSMTLVSIARDTYVPYAGGGRGKINGSFAAGGTDNLSGTVSALLGGLPIHYAVQSNFTGFINITRWLGGFEVQNQKATRVTVQSTGRTVVFPSGPLALGGTDALIYSRERKTMPLGDLDRAERHRAVLTGMLARLQSRVAEDPAGFLDLLANLVGNVKVTGSLDPDNLGGLIPAIQAVGAGGVVSLMVPITGFDTVGGASVNRVDERRTRELAAALKEGDVSGYVERYGTGYAPTGG